MGDTDTLQTKTNMEAKGGGLEDIVCFLMGDFQVQCEFRGGMLVYNTYL